MNNYLVSQILVILATIFISVTYFEKNRKNILILFIFYSVLYGIHYLLLSALTGFFMNMVSIGRNIIFYRHEKKKQENSIYFLIILFIIIILFGVFSYNDMFSIISMSASLISTYSVWQRNIKVYRVLAIIVSICFIIYAIHINSLFAIITEVILLMAEFIGVLLLVLKKGK